MSQKENEDSRHLRELGELRALLWSLANDEGIPAAVKVAAAKELRAVSEAMDAAVPAKPAKVAQLEALRLKAVNGGKK